MSSKSKGVVIRNNPIYLKVGLTGYIVLALLMFILPSNYGGFNLTRVPVPTILPLPILLGSIWLGTFKVTLLNNELMVRKLCITKKIGVNDIAKISCIETCTNVTRNTVILVKAKNCKFRIDESMANFEIFEEYIKNNIPQDKISVVKNDIRTH